MGVRDEARKRVKENVRKARQQTRTVVEHGGAHRPAVDMIRKTRTPRKKKRKPMGGFDDPT